MKIGTGTRTLILAAALACSLSATAAANPGDCKDIQTDKGAISGTFNEKSDLCTYKGIPFAAPPVGELRFARPQEHAPWTDTLDAVKYGNECLQMAMSLFPSNKSTGDEDCLYLNIMAPVAAVKSAKPVMIFFHGGGFIYGSGSVGMYTGTGLALQGDVIVVTVNYRLGAFGYLVHPALKDKDGIEGNYGIWDQVAAIKWVKNNIKKFGGDPNNITIFGESAGGISVGLHLLAPASRGLFQKAIIESGPALMIKTDLQTAEKDGLAAAAKLGCTDPATAAVCLRKIDAQTLINSLPAGIFFLSSEETKGTFGFGPIVDGKLIPDLPMKMFERGEYSNDVKVMLGTNSDEATYFIISRKLDTTADFRKTLADDAVMMKKNLDLDMDADKIASFYPPEKYSSPRKAYSDMFTDLAFTCSTRFHANLLAAHQKDVYLYYFAKKPVDSGPFKEWGAFHGVELAFVFDKFDFMGIKFASKSNSQTAKKVIALWSSFARDGVPSGPGLPVWKQYEPDAQPFMRIDLDVTAGQGLNMDKCKYFETYYRQAFLK